MAIQIKGDGTWAAEYEGPYLGLDTEKPETLISDKVSPSFNNFMLRNAELRSRPALTLPFNGTVLNGPFQPFTVGISSFLDINGTYHTVAWSGPSLYQYDPTLLPASPWRVVGPAGPATLVQQPLAYRTFANNIYYTSSAFLAQRGGGGIPVVTPFLAYWDGITAAPIFQHTFGDGSTSNSIAGISLTTSPTVGGSLPGGPTIIGPIAIGAGYLAELNNQLILANISIKDQGNGKIYNFPTLIWWSANGLPLQWDPTVNTSAGENPFLDVQDQITGLAMLGIAGYIFRTNGITQMTPTGSAVTPWEFDHMWASEHGIGNILPWSIAQYGPTAAFVAQDNIYSLSVTNAQPIGGTARDAIMADLANAAWPPVANIIPIFTAGYVYLTYVLLIPFATFVRQWTYSFEEKNWAPWDLAIPQSSGISQQLTCAPNVV